MLFDINEFDLHLKGVQFEDRIDSTNGPQDLTAVLQNSVGMFLQ